MTTWSGISFRIFADHGRSGHDEEAYRLGHARPPDRPGLAAARHQPAHDPDRRNSRESWLARACQRQQARRLRVGSSTKGHAPLPENPHQGLWLTDHKHVVLRLGAHDSPRRRPPRRRPWRQRCRRARSVSDPGGSRHPYKRGWHPRTAGRRTLPGSCVRC